MGNTAPSAVDAERDYLRITVEHSYSRRAPDALLALAKVLPADWTARLFAANAAIDAKFLLALLDAPLAQRVQEQLNRVQRLPERLKDALLAEAADSVRTAA